MARLAGKDTHSGGKPALKIEIHSTLRRKVRFSGPPLRQSTWPVGWVNMYQIFDFSTFS